LDLEAQHLELQFQDLVLDFAVLERGGVAAGGVEFVVETARACLGVLGGDAGVLDDLQVRGGDAGQVGEVDLHQQVSHKSRKNERCESPPKTYGELGIDFGQCVAGHTVRDLEFGVGFRGQDARSFLSDRTGRRESEKAQENCGGGKVHCGDSKKGNADEKGNQVSLEKSEKRETEPAVLARCCDRWISNFSSEFASFILARCRDVEIKIKLSQPVGSLAAC
jgi:hypothetical protein